MASMAERTAQPPRVMVQIDADNIPPWAAEAVLSAAGARGEIVEARAYGHWRNPTLSSWARQAERLGIKRVGPAFTVPGKNSTDIVIAMDAIEVMLTREDIDTFVLVSSDADFCGLAERLMREGRRVIRVTGGNAKPEVARCCSEVVLLDAIAAMPEIADAQFLKILADVRRGSRTPWTPLSALGEVLSRSVAGWTPRLRRARTLVDAVSGLGDQVHLMRGPTGGWQYRLASEVARTSAAA